MIHPNILICYSNPGTTGRLRLDVEHREIEAALKEVGADSSYVKRIHATTIDDLISEIGSNKYQLIQFSGHGDKEGVYLENSDHTKAELLDSTMLERVLSVASNNLKVLILTCCYSDSYRESLAQKVPYLITITGPAPDRAAINFSKWFYSTLLRSENSIEVSFAFAKAVSEDLTINLSRRGLLKQPGELKVEAKINFGNKIILDLTPIKNEIFKISENEESFINAICTSIRAHYSLFKLPMERVALPFDQHIGIFSWNNEIDPISCEQVFLVSNDISEAAFEVFARLMSRYTSLASARYRYKNEREYPGKSKLIKSALDRFYETTEQFFSGDNANQLRNLSPNHYKVAAGMIRANLAEADAAWAQDDLAQCIVFLETSLTTLHNFIMQLVQEVKD